MSVASSSSSAAAAANEHHRELQETRPMMAARGAAGAGGIHHLAHAATMTLEGGLLQPSHHPSTNHPEEYLETFHTTETEEPDSPATPEKEDFWETEEGQAFKLDKDSKYGIEGLLDGAAQQQSCWDQLLKDAGKTEQTLKSVLQINMIDKIVKPLKQQIHTTMQKLQNDLVKAFHDNNLRRNTMQAKFGAVENIARDCQHSLWQDESTTPGTGDGIKAKEASTSSSDGSKLVLGSDEFWQDIMEQRHPPDSLDRIHRFLESLEAYVLAFNTFEDSIDIVTANFNGTTESFLEITSDIVHPVRTCLDETQAILQDMLVKNYKRRSTGQNGAVKKKDAAADEFSAYGKKPNDETKKRKRKWEK